MARPQRLIRVCTALAFIFLLFATGNAHADSGVFVTVWDNNTGFNQYNSAPPLPPTTEIAGTFTADNVKANFDQQPVFNLFEDFVVRYEGFITAPTTSTVRFYAPADDGIKFFFNDELIINDWRDKGGGGSISRSVQLIAGVPQQFTLWFYENGGGAWLDLMWDLEGYWQTVPASAFSVHQTETTTTTQQPEATTTEPQTTTTSEAPTTTNLLVVSQTTVQPVVTDPPATTTTDLPVQIVTSQPAQTVASTVPAATTVAASTTAAPAATQPETTTSLTIQEPTSEPLSANDPQILDLITNLDESTPEEITAAIESIVDAGITADAAAALATEPEILQVATPEQAQEIFEALDLATLDNTQLEELVVAVQSAPEEVRHEFESAVNVFDGAIDSYVPIGSSVPISTRRLVIAAGALLSAAAIPTGKRK